MEYKVGKTALRLEKGKTIHLLGIAFASVQARKEELLP